MSRIVGIDLGSYSVKVVRIEPRGRGTFEVLGFSEQPLPDEGSLEERHSAALAVLKQQGALDGDTYVTGLSGDASAVRTLQFPFSDPKKIAEALPFALESEIPVDIDDVVLSWAILGRSAVKRKDAVVSTDVLVAWAKKEAVQALLDLLAVHGIDPRHVELSALALDDLYDGLFKPVDAAAATTREGPTEMRTPGGTVIEMGEGAPEPAVAVVDIGHRSTSVCVLGGDGRVVSAHSILHGGADATRSLSKAIGLPLDEAERGKRKEAFIEVAGARAQFPEQEQISEVLKGAYAPIVRRLRQIFQASISQARVRVMKVIIVGGASRVLNLDRHMSEELNVKVVRGPELSRALAGQLPLGAGEDGAPEAALAFAYAMSGAVGNKTRARIDFRTGEFAWRGDFDFLREKAPALATWAAVLVLLLGVSGIARAFVLARTDDALQAQELALCKEITGKPDLTSFSVCMSMIQERIRGQASFSVPARSAVDTYMEIAQRLPPESELHRKITELDITADRVKMRGLTSGYEAIDKIVERLQGGKCFSLVEKGKAQNKGSDVEFNITITLDCNTAPGDGKPPPPITTATRAAPTGAPPPMAVPPPRLTSPVDDDSQNEPAAANVPSRPPPPFRPSEDASSPRAAKLSPAEIQERRERLRKLREEREARRATRIGGDTMLNNPLATPRNPALRQRMMHGQVPTLAPPKPVTGGKDDE